MKKHLHLDCFSGISGNMLLGALLDSGADEAFLRENLRHLNIGPYELQIERKQINGFAATQVEVSAQEENSHHHRHLADIEKILLNSSLDAVITDQAFAVFKRLAEAEANVHGTTIDQIHFHEVGAVDAIVDIVGCVACLQCFAPYSLSCSALPMPGGWVKCAHGEIPLPAPAVCALLKDKPVYGVNLQQELVTPTGAALVCELASFFGELPSMTLHKTGHGAGTMLREDGKANLLRLYVGNPHQLAEAQEVAVLESHLDDWNPELWPHVSNLLMQSAALDTALIPMLMKKGRPGYLLRVICEPEEIHTLEGIIFKETSTLGIRRRLEKRSTLPREAVQVASPWGEITAKKIHGPDGTTIVPEYEACRKVAIEHKIALKAVYAAVAKSPSNI